MDLWRRVEMPSVVDETVHIRGPQGWLDRQIVESLVLLNLAGGDCVTDMDRLEADAGLCRMFGRSQYSGMREFVPEQRPLAVHGNYRRHKGERQREHGVLDLYHLEDDARLTPESRHNI